MSKGDDHHQRARAACDCIHEPALHDPITGACLYPNPITGACPCAATPPATRVALEAACRALAAALKVEKFRRTR